uniref:Uncharacterized protein n=1 Tax=Rhizophora mucronata TaxID=61149 RepID=A0A2P2JFS1_RHIMU
MNLLKFLFKLTDKINVYGTHCTSQNYPVSPLWIVYGLIRIWDFQSRAMWCFNGYQGLILEAG